ncbi:MAG: CapA family protein [Saprospiraceae bacterium]|nr:CapA family protein [Saprospiraceae bacterium]
MPASLGRYCHRFFDADIRFANLETPIDPSKPAALVPEVMLNNMNFNGSAAMFDIFNAQNLSQQPADDAGRNLTQRNVGRKIGFDVLSTANNHSLDMGETGVFATLDFLSEKKLVQLVLPARRKGV